MEYNEDRDLLRNNPTFTLPPPPRFDAAASAAARPVEPLPGTTIQVPLKPKFSRLVNRRSKFLALMAIVGFATGAAGGILVVKKDKQQPVENSASMIQIPIEQTLNSDSAAPAPENNGFEVLRISRKSRSSTAQSPTTPQTAQATGSPLKRRRRRGVGSEQRRR